MELKYNILINFKLKFPLLLKKRRDMDFIFQICFPCYQLVTSAILWILSILRWLPRVELCYLLTTLVSGRGDPHGLSIWWLDELWQLLFQVEVTCMGYPYGDCDELCYILTTLVSWAIRMLTMMTVSSFVIVWRLLFQVEVTRMG